MIHWRKSSHSQGGGQGECIEVSTNTSAAVLVRDSRNPSGPRLRLSQSQFGTLVNTIKTAALP